MGPKILQAWIEQKFAGRQWLTHLRGDKTQFKITVIKGNTRDYSILSDFTVQILFCSYCITLPLVFKIVDTYPSLLKTYSTKKRCGALIKWYLVPKNSKINYSKNKDHGLRILTNITSKYFCIAKLHAGLFLIQKFLLK